MNSSFSHFTSNYYEDQEEITKKIKCALCGSTNKLNAMVCSKCADHVFQDGNGEP